MSHDLDAAPPTVHRKAAQDVTVPAGPPPKAAPGRRRSVRNSVTWPKAARSRFFRIGGGARSKTTVAGLRVLLVVAWLGSWELAGAHWIDPFYYSKPSNIWQRLVDWFTTGTAFGSIWAQISVTLQEAVLGFIIGSAAGVVFGILLGRARLLADVCAPFVKAANAIPRIVLASLFVIWFGLGLSSKVATAVVLVFFAVFFNAFQGAREVDRTLVDNARILGAGKRQILTSIVLPSATSWITASLHTAFGFALIGAVVGEFVGADKGLGLLINNAQGTFDSAGIYAGMIVITVIALIAESLITLLERRLLVWRPQSQSTATGF